MVKVTKPKKEFWETNKKPSHLRISRKINEADERLYVVSLKPRKRRGRKPKIYDWSKLNNFQLNMEGRHFAETEFRKAGFDVYVSAKYHRTIDFILKKDKKYYEVQVSSVRENSQNIYYAFAKKDYFQPKENLLFALLIFGDKKTPYIYLVPSLNWTKNKYDFLIEGGFENGKNGLELAISINPTRIDLFRTMFAFNKQVKKL